MLNQAETERQRPGDMQSMGNLKYQTARQQQLQ